MSPTLLQRLRHRWFSLLCLAALVVGLPVSCAVLEHKERQLVFRIEPGTAGWYRGLPSTVQEFREALLAGRIKIPFSCLI